MNRISKNSDSDYLVWRVGSGETIEIFDIAVNSERRVGVGRSMISELKEIVGDKTIFAITREQNEIAHKFYEKNGFTAIMLPKFYEDGDARMYILYRKV